MESMYGGKPGVSFILKGNFSSVTGMVEAFKKGNKYQDIWYSEYCIIDTPNKNDADNGKIYRRGLNYQNSNGGAEYIGQIVGPSSGTPFFDIKTLQEINEITSKNLDNDEYRRFYDNNGLVIDKTGISKQYSFNVDSNNLVPGHTAQTNNDDIIYNWVNVRKDDSDSDSWFYIGMQIPYLVHTFTSIMNSPYDDAGNISANSTTIVENSESDNHPFWQSWTIGIPKGVKGDTLRNLRVYVPQSSDKIYSVDAFEVNAKTGETSLKPNASNYSGFNDDVTNQRQILVFDVYVYDKNISPLPIMVYLGSYNQIDNIEVQDDGTLIVGYTHDDDKSFDNRIKWIHNVTLDSNTGVFTVNYNNGDSPYSMTLDWIRNISVDDEGTITYTHTNSAIGNVKDIHKIKWITNAATSQNGITTLYLNTGESFTIKTKASVGSASPIDFKIKTIENVSLATDLVADKHINIKYNTESSSTPIGDSINFIKDMVIQSDSESPLAYHLLVLFTDPNHRLSTPPTNPYTDSNGITWTQDSSNINIWEGSNGETWIQRVVGSDGKTTASGIFWRDYGSVKDDDGILISRNITPEMVQSAGYDNIVKYLNNTYDTGLGYQVVTYGDSEDKKDFYGFDYTSQDNGSYTGWYYLGSFENSGKKDAKLLVKTAITKDDIIDTSANGLIFKIVNKTVSDTPMPEKWATSYVDW